MFLKAVDAITGSAPHTNEAEKKAKGDGEAMQHHFGAASYFLTVTSDDDNSFVVQVLHIVAAEGIATDAEIIETRADFALLGHPVQNPARAAAAKQQGIRTSQDFDLLQVVKRPEVLNVIPGAIDVEVGS